MPVGPLSLLLAIAALQTPDAGAPAPQLTKMPTLVRHVPAEYPEAARAAGREAEVVLQLVVDEAGKVRDVRVAQSAGPDFDEPALAAARQFEFAPAEVDGKPATVQIDYHTVFTLQVEPPKAPARRFSGQVRDLSTDLPIERAVVWLRSVDRESLTAADGSFAIEGLSPGAYAVTVAAEGYEQLQSTTVVEERSEASATYRLARQRKTVYETLVVGHRPREEVRRNPVGLETRPIVSAYQLNKRDVELTVGSLEDVARVVQSLPGVVGDPDLAATFFVRGGDADETLFYLDGMPLSNPYHLGGFATVFNPELVRDITFWAGVQPAPHRSSLSGSLEVGYLTPSAAKFEALADLSASTAKALVAGPTPIEGLSFLLSGRRSYFELYFALLKQLHVVGQRFVAPDVGEYTAKLTYRKGAHLVDLSLTQSTDGLNFVGSPGDDALFVFEGGLRTQNTLWLPTLAWRWRPSEDLSVRSLLGYADDRSEVERTGIAEGATTTLINSADTRFRDVVWRTDADFRTHGENHLRVGFDIDLWWQSFSGRVEDTRAVPRWITTPLADWRRPKLDVSPSLRRVNLGLYLEDEWRDLLPRLTPRVGLRAEFAEGLRDPMVSPRVALSYRLFEPTVVKAAFGLFWEAPRNPLELDRVYGNPDLGPEMALQYLVGVEQLLPLRTLLRVEGYYKDLRNLVVNPDNAAAVARGTTFANDGSGWAWGADAMLVHRGEKLGFGLSYGYLRTLRTNPLNEVFAKTYAPQQAQAHTFSASVDYAPWESWVFALKYLFHVGRPYTPIGGWRLEERDGQQVYVPILGDGDRLNDASVGDFHELNARVEYWFRQPKYRVTIYFELLNVTNAKSVFLVTYDSGDPASGTLPKEGRFNHLPIRPFLGVRGEY